MGKYILDIETIQPGSLGAAADIRHVVVLQDPDEAAMPTGSRHELTLLLDRADDGLLRDIGQIEGVEAVDASLEGDHPSIRVRARQRTAALYEIEALCRRRQVLILDVTKRIPGRPDFETPARLEPLPKSEAIMELLRGFQGGHGSDLLQEEFGGSAARLFWEMGSLVEGAACHRLTVGPLDQMADLVCGLVETGG